MTKENLQRGIDSLQRIDSLEKEISILKVSHRGTNFGFYWTRSFSDDSVYMKLEKSSYDADILDKAFAEMIAAREKQIEELQKLFEKL